MKNNWYKRLLLSYLPILFITVSVIIFVFVSIISQYSIIEAKKANSVFVNYVMDSVQSNLKQIENAILEEMTNNDNFAFYNFFEMDVADTAAARITYYEASKEMGKIIDMNPLIDSMYLYRSKDRMVLTSSELVSLHNFRDKEFVESEMGRQGNATWSPVRPYSDSPIPQDQNKDIVTLAKKALIPLGDQGVVVVNVDVKSLFQMVDAMVNPDISYLDIRSSDGKTVYPLPAAGAGIPHGKVISELHSDDLDWNFTSGFKTGPLFGWVSVISRYWFAVGGVAIVLSILYLLFVTRRNYKPIEAIVRQIYAYQPAGGKGDEFAFIGSVLERLMLQTHEYEKRYREDLIVHRKQVFRELIEGRTPVAKSDWKSQMDRFGMNPGFSHLAVAIVDIDKYEAFQREYSRSDQNLLKFAVTNAVSEFLKESNLTVWAEWLGGERLAILYLSEADEMRPNLVWDLLDRFRTWAAVNLRFSMTIGVGATKRDIAGIARSFGEAETALEYKMSLGGNQVISYEEIGESTPGDTHKYIQMMNQLAQDLRVMNDGWQLQLEMIFQHLDEDLLKNDEIRHLFGYMLQLLRREADKLPEEASAYWTDTAEPQLAEALEHAESVGELAPVALQALEQLFQVYKSARESRGNRQLIMNIRSYIEDHYADPDLSLSHISVKFDVNAKYASQLFKEGFGMKFIDFIVHLRMEKAKRLLLETDRPITDISEQVGYTHPISFGRSFKKLIGVTPGDFRKYMQS